MEIRPLPADEGVVRRYVEELWLPYHRELAATVDRHALAEDIALVAEEAEFRLDKLESDPYRGWIAVDVPQGEGSISTVDLADGKGTLGGFITTDVEESPTVFNRPDQLLIEDIYAQEAYRGSSLARELVDQVVQYAREAGCAELTLDVNIDNERATRFHEKLSFQTYCCQMSVPVEKL